MVNAINSNLASSTLTLLDSVLEANQASDNLKTQLLAKTMDIQKQQAEDLLKSLSGLGKIFDARV